MEDNGLIRDRLTGLLNIQGFRDMVDEVSKVVEAKGNRPVAYAFFDLVDFKSYNERYGFENGNKVLIAFADLLVKSFPGRTFARISGDHFAGYFYKDELELGVSSLTKLMRADKLMRETHFRIGLYFTDKNDMDSAICIDRAKIAADSIRGQEDGLRIYDAELDEMTRRTRYIAENIEYAISNGFIKVYYQPVVRTMTGVLCGMEALARWDDPNYGMLSPGLFIPILEGKGLIYRLDSYVIGQVCYDIRRWQDEGLTVVPVSLNLTRIDFELCDIIGILEENVRKYNVQKSLIHIEITESTLNSQEDLIAEKIKEIHSLGYEVWMDDFGSGYSSLNVLKDYDFDMLKIDMKFLSNFSDRSKSVISSVVHMAKRLGIHTLAEGVETAEHVKFLEEIGCEKMQGYYFSRPVPCDGEMFDLYERRWGIENSRLRAYYDRLGLMDSDSIVQMDFSDEPQDETESDTDKYLRTRNAVACFEYDGKSYHHLAYTKSYLRVLQEFGIPSAGSLEEYANNGTSPFGRRFLSMMDQILDSKSQRRNFWLDFDVSGQQGVLRVHRVTSSNGRTAFVCMVENLSDSSEYQRVMSMNGALKQLSSIYDRIDIVDYDEDCVKNVVARIVYPELNRYMSVEEIIQTYAREYIASEDRERYLALVDQKTLLNRIKDSGNGFITDYFRTKTKSGHYAWMQYYFMWIGDFNNQVLECMKQISQMASDALYLYYDEKAKRAEMSPAPSESVIHRSELWDTLMQDKNFGIFWKDEKRKFCGANNVFLDYYGFHSSQEILGKDDEEMGWHINPDAFRQDEWDVLKKGRVTNMVPGQCIANGTVRNIAATKRPIYRNGEIIGLLGYFIDVTKDMNLRSKIAEGGLHDKLTGLLSGRGFRLTFPEYEEAYRFDGVDFAMYYLDIKNFRQFNRNFGVDFGDHVLNAVASTLETELGKKSVICRYTGDIFLVLHQFLQMDEIEAVRKQIEDAINSIREVDDVYCNLYSHTGVATYSSYPDLDNLFRHAEENMKERRKADEDKNKEE